MQTTLKRAITLVGMGLHSGRPARLVLRPATEGGIRFRRVDVTDRDNLIPARYDLVTDTTLCTLLTNEAGVSVGTVEHLMAALAGTGVTHVEVEIDGPEVPIMDGSAQRFVGAILRAGLAPVAGPLTAIRILKPVRWEQGAVVGRARAGGDAVDRLRDRLPRRRDRPPGACAVDGQRHLRPRARRLPDLLPAAGRRDDAGERPRPRRVARQRRRRRRRRRCSTRAASAARTSASATRCSTRSATSRSPARRSSAPTAASAPGTARPTSCSGRSSPMPEAFEIVTLDAEAAAQLPGAGVGAADLRRAG